ncbi:MAG: ComEC/Rec2 family competence protein [Chloroherpetonaceae bacterium]|nr:ComEC/Rec2 family competence protein [Chloroherpetonaceae bacterium]
MICAVIGICLGKWFHFLFFPTLFVASFIAIVLMLYSLWPLGINFSFSKATVFSALSRPIPKDHQSIAATLYFAFLISSFAALSSYHFSIISERHVLNLAGRYGTRYSPVEIEAIGIVQTLPKVKVKEPRVTVEWTLAAESLRVKPGNPIFHSKQSQTSLAHTFSPSEGLIRVKYYINSKGTEAESLRIGERIRIRGRIQLPQGAQNKGEFDYRAFLAERGIDLILNAAFLSDLERRKERALGWWGTWVSEPGFRYLERVISRSFPESEETALLKGILLGVKSDIEPDILLAFQNTGTMHVLTVSGLHIGLLLLVFNSIFKRFKTTSFGRWSIFLLLIFFLLSFSSITGNAPPVKRAVAMALLFEFASLLRFPTFNFNTLALANFIILLFEPSDLFSGSFHLTNGAVIAILLYFPIFTRPITDDAMPPLLKHPPAWIRAFVIFVWESLAMTLAATLGTSPFVAFYFGKIPLLGLFANIPVVLFANFATYALAAASLISLLSEGLGGIYVSAAHLFSSLTIGSAILFSKIPFASTSISVSVLMVAAFCVLLLSLAMYESPKVWPKFLIVSLLLFTSDVWIRVFQFEENQQLPDAVMCAMTKSSPVIFFTGKETILLDASFINQNLSRLKSQSVAWHSKPTFTMAVQHKTPYGILDDLADTVLSFNHFRNKTQKVKALPTAVISSARGGSLKVRTKKGIMISASLFELDTLGYYRADFAALRITRFQASDLDQFRAWLLWANPKCVGVALAPKLSATERKRFYRFIRQWPEIKITERDGEVVFYF